LQKLEIWKGINPVILAGDFNTEITEEFVNELETLLGIKYFLEKEKSG
jgi:endonuclease/exonuclease/phosphatase (EEP) superfamily protein YafD